MHALIITGAVVSMVVVLLGSTAALFLAVPQEGISTVYYYPTSAVEMQRALYCLSHLIDPVAPRGLFIVHSEEAV